MIPRYKDIVELIKKGSTMEAQEKILELREAAMELQSENVDLRREVETLTDLLHKKERMTYVRPFYYAECDDVPHCARCWEVEHKAVHLPEPFRSAAGPVYTCLECSNKIIHRDE